MRYNDNSDAIVKLVFNAYPNAIHAEDDDGDTPLDDASETEIGSLFEQQIELERQARTERTPDNNGQLPIHRALRNADASLGGIKLMLAANPTSIAVVDNQGHTPLHIACHAGNLDAAKFLMEVNHDLSQATDIRGNLPLHLACMGGNCEVVSCILEQSTYGVTLQNSNEQSPIELLFFESESDRDSMDYVEAIGCLFQANPEKKEYRVKTMLLYGVNEFTIKMRNTYYGTKQIQSALSIYFSIHTLEVKH